MLPGLARRRCPSLRVRDGHGEKNYPENDERNDPECGIQPGHVDEERVRNRNRKCQQAHPSVFPAVQRSRHKIVEQSNDEPGNANEAGRNGVVERVWDHEEGCAKIGIPHVLGLQRQAIPLPVQNPGTEEGNNAKTDADEADVLRSDEKREEEAEEDHEIPDDDEPGAEPDGSAEDEKARQSQPDEIFRRAELGDDRHAQRRISQHRIHKCRIDGTVAHPEDDGDTQQHSRGEQMRGDKIVLEFRNGQQQKQGVSTPPAHDGCVSAETASSSSRARQSEPAAKILIYARTKKIL